MALRRSTDLAEGSLRTLSGLPKNQIIAGRFPIGRSGEDFFAAAAIFLLTTPRTPAYNSVKAMMERDGVSVRSESRRMV